MKINSWSYGVVGLKRLMSKPLFWFILLLMLLTLIQTMSAIAFSETPQSDAEHVLLTLVTL